MQAVQTIFVADISLVFRELPLEDRKPTGAQIAGLAGFAPRDEATVVQFLNDGEFEDLRMTELTDLSRGNHFLVVRSDRTFRFTLDGRRIDWPADRISGKSLRLLGKVASAKSIYLAQQDQPDRQLRDDDVVKLTADGIEAFYSSKQASWSINVQGVLLEWHEPSIVVRTAMEKTGFDTSQRWHIFLKVQGQPKTEVNLDSVVDLTTPGLEKIRLTPKDVHNGEAGQMVSEFALLEADEDFLDRHFTGWETIVEGGRRWLLIHNYPVPAGYSVTEVDLALEVPPSYPGAQIDMFYLEPPLSLPGGGAPGATDARVNIRGKSFQRWSRHRGQEHPWNPASDNVITHLALVEAALMKEISP